MIPSLAGCKPAYMYVLRRKPLFPQHRAHFAGFARSWLQLAKMFEAGIRQSDRGDGKIVVPARSGHKDAAAKSK